jgi:murein DD-endopeptidase MepM/ murein hydrolase activator NlpD
MAQRRRPLLHGFVLAPIAFGVLSSVFVSKAFPFQADNANAVTSLSLPSLGAVPPEEAVLTSGVVRDTMRRQDLERYVAAVSGTELPATPSPAATTAPTEAPKPLFVAYTVQSGDTASSIAGHFGITLQYLLWNNPELRDGDVLSVGDVLFIPSGNGMLHYVSLGETISGIATYYGVGVDEIVAFPSNNLASPDQVVEGQLVFVPNGVPPSSVAPVPTEEPVLVAAATPEPRPDAPSSTAAPPVSTPPPQASSGSGLIWPFSAPLSRGFGGGHMGIDIDGYCCPNAAIVAAHGGTVSFAGGSSCCGYGLYVDVRRSDGLVTRYAHLSSIHVSIGQSVSQGQTLGIIGRTGNATGIHLHFEVRVGGSPVDPLGYLP